MLTNDYADMLLDPVWISWCQINKAHIDKLIGMYYNNPNSVMRFFSREGQEITYENLAQLMECLEATLNEIEKH